MKKKPGPKPKSSLLKYRTKSLSFPPEQADFLDSLQEVSYFMQELLTQSPDYKKHLKELENRCAT